MKKAAFTISLVIVGAIAIFYFADLFNNSPAELTTASPNKTYKVYMQDREAVSFEHIVHFNVTKNK